MNERVRFLTVSLISRIGALLMKRFLMFEIVIIVNYALCNKISPISISRVKPFAPKVKQAITSPVSTKFAVLNIKMAMMDTPRLANTGIRAQFVPQIN